MGSGDLTSEEQLSEELVHRAAAGRGFAVERTLSVGNRHTTAHSRGVFRLQLKDGSALKARLFENESIARHVATLSRMLPPEWSARCLGQSGRVVFSEWVKGVTPHDPRESGETMRAIARLQASLHSIEGPENASPHDCVAIEKWQQLFGGWLELLRDQDVLTPAHCRRLLSAAEAPPSSARVVMSHGDLCYENLIRATNGALVLIDHETLNRSPVEFDLARTLYLSDFNEEEASRYLTHYADATEGPEYAAGALAWWAPLVWSQSAQFRLKNERPGWELAVRRLRARAELGDAE